MIGRKCVALPGEPIWLALRSTGTACIGYLRAQRHSVARNHPRWQSYRATIIGTRPTIVVISCSRCANSDVWHATDRRSWEAPHSISHSVTRITSHLLIRLSRPANSLTTLAESTSAYRGGRHGLSPRIRDLNFARMTTRATKMRFLERSARTGSQEAVTWQNGFSLRVRSLTVYCSFLYPFSFSLLWSSFSLLCFVCEISCSYPTYVLFPWRFIRRLWTQQEISKERFVFVLLGCSLCKALHSTYLQRWVFSSYDSVAWVFNPI